MAKIKVLLVEDEPTLAMIIKDTLDGEEFDIVLDADGEEGLALYKEVKPDIIVTDIMMPKIDGFTVIRHIRKTDSQIPVLFLSARSAANDVVEGFELGGNDYLKKPFGMAELIDIAFLDERGQVLESYRAVGPRRRIRCRKAVAVLERFSVNDPPWFSAGEHVEMTRKDGAGK